MRQAGDEVRQVQEQRLRDLHIQYAEIWSHEEETEEIVLLIPEDHPLNRIEPMEQQLTALAADVTQLRTQNAILLDLVNKIGGMTFEMYKVMATAQRKPETAIVVPGRN
jgi:hypothetical protein